jgi:hypothetical protein
MWKKGTGAGERRAAELKFGPPSVVNPRRAP